MVEKSAEQSTEFQVGEHVDCLDTVSKWCNAEIASVDNGSVYIHYTGFSTKYDEWIDLNHPDQRHRVVK
jgi:hypothetical protein